MESSIVKPRGFRWWPAVLILFIILGRIAWVHQQHEANQQEANIHTMIACIIGAAFLFIWFMLFSRLRWKVRLLSFAAMILAGLLGLAAFEIHGVTGNLLPVLRWRWSPPSGPDLTSLSSGQLANTNAPARTDPGTGSYPQFLGPNRNAKIDGPALVPDWKMNPPELLWRNPVGLAWSGFVVSGPYAVTQEQQEEKELVVCYDLKSGQPLWAHSDQSRFSTTIAGTGPRATATIDGNRVYALGAKGILNCLDLATGRPIWSTNILEANQAKLGSWGVSGSPLVLEDHVVVSPGGKNGRSLVAYDKLTGAFAWGGGEDGAGYSSPCLFNLQGTPQVLIFNSGTVAAHDPATGTLLWDYPWRKGHPHVAVPVLLPENEVFVSSGYGTGCERLQIVITEDGTWNVTQVWKSNRMKAKFTNPVYHDGYIYGLDDGIMACVDVAEGQRQWKDGRYGHGQVILVDDVLLVMCENGEVVLLDPVPEENRELTRFSALSGKTWNPPALAGAYLLVRNDQEAACYRLKLKP